MTRLALFLPAQLEKKFASSRLPDHGVVTCAHWSLHRGIRISSTLAPPTDRSSTRLMALERGGGSSRDSISADFRSIPSSSILAIRERFTPAPGQSPAANK